MKQIFLYILFLAGFLGPSATSVSSGQRNEEIKATLFGLLQLKIKFEQQNFKTYNKTDEERNKIIAAQFDKSDYKKAAQEIGNNPRKYLRYINKVMKSDAEMLSREYVDWQPILIHESRAPDYYYISKLDYLKAVRYSLFNQKSNQLLPLFKIPGIKPRYPKTVN